MRGGAEEGESCIESYSASARVCFVYQVSYLLQ